MIGLFFLFNLLFLVNPDTLLLMPKCFYLTERNESEDIFMLEALQCLRSCTETYL